MQKKRWGFYVIIKEYDNMKIKLLHFNPNSETSLQTHNHRKELMFIKSGSAIIRKGEEDIFISKGSYIEINKKEKHKIRNNSNKNSLEIIEIQTGICDENDIIRYKEEIKKSPSVLSKKTIELLKRYKENVIEKNKN